MSEKYSIKERSVERVVSDRSACHYMKTGKGCAKIIFHYLVLFKVKELFHSDNDRGDKYLDPI